MLCRLVRFYGLDPREIRGLSTADLFGLMGNLGYLKAEEKLEAIRAGAFASMTKETQQEILHEIRTVLGDEETADRMLAVERHMDYHRKLEEEKKHGL